jgi:hypothetical protein
MSTQPLSAARRLEAERQIYTAMNPAEILVWVQFLRLYEQNYDVLPASWLALRATQLGKQPAPGDVFDYNVRIGSGADPGPAFDQTTRNMAIMATQFRIDAVGFQGDTPILFEVKRDAGPAQIGQLLSYDALWRKQKVTPVDPQMVMVAADFKPNALALLSESGIQLITVPVDFKQLSPYAPVVVKST